MDTKEKKPKNYLNNRDMMEQVRLSRELGRPTDELANMFIVLVARYAKHPNYASVFSYEEDMQAHGLLTLVKQWHYFNPDKSNNPFAYYTQICKHAFYEYLRKEKKQRMVRNAYMVELGVEPHQEYLDELDKMAVGLEDEPAKEEATVHRTDDES